VVVVTIGAHRHGPVRCVASPISTSAVLAIVTGATAMTASTGVGEAVIVPVGAYPP
jgi:hypothetical protein